MSETLDITTEELDIIKQLIELSANNGLISAKNFTAVGSLYEKIDILISEIDSLDND